MNERLEKLIQVGQSLWYDNIERKLLEDGSLEKMIERGEIRGITSNPSIFNKAISDSTEYDSQIQKLTEEGLTKEKVFERLSMQDIQAAADLFSTLYQETSGGDGFVSLEVNPYLANLTEETVAEAKKLWHLIDRPNLMVKIPATLEGLPAITEAIAAGININVTLIFSLDRYQKVMDAYLSGLEKRVEAGLPLDYIASVASFFLSRIDTKVDHRLELILKDKSPQQQDYIRGLLGKSALASGKIAFMLYRETFGSGGKRFKKLEALGARPQRVLWASTSTKNPAYPDTMYVDELVGPGTVNTLPPHTLKAFLDHGSGNRSIDQGLDAAQELFTELKSLGIDIRQITDELEVEGVKAFADAYTSLLDSLARRMADFK